jgi:replicative DNA helicase
MSVDVTGRVPPQDLDAEAAVLACVFIAGRDVLADIVDIVAPKDFYSNSHVRIFEAMLAEYREQQPVDLVTVLKRLKTTDRLREIVDGPGYLTEIMNCAPAVANVVAYADRVRQLSVQRRLLRHLSEAIGRIYLGVEDVPRFLDQLERHVHEAAVDRVRVDSLEQIGAVGMRVYHQALARRDSGKTMLGTPTGFSRLDRETGGVHPGDLSIVAARPGMGKTAFAINIASKVAAYKDRDTTPLVSVVFSLEMPREQLAQRAMCSDSKIDMGLFRTGQLDDRAMRRIHDAALALKSLGVYIDDQARSIEAIRSMCRRKQSDLARVGKQIGLVVIDYLQIMDLPAAERHDIRIGEVTRGLKLMAIELKVPVMLLSQLNRKCEDRQDKRPVKSDLKDSGAIEQDADNIYFIYRDDNYNADSDEKNIAEIIIDKQRNGVVGTIKLRFDKEYTRFDNLADDHEYAYEVDPPPPQRSRTPPPVRDFVDLGNGKSNHDIASPHWQEDE